MLTCDFFECALSYGLSGEDIPLIGRIAAIADVFDAFTSNRPYKKAWLEEEAFKLIENERGEHFDPQLVSVFFGKQKRDNKNKGKIYFLSNILEISIIHRKTKYQFF